MGIFMKPCAVARISGNGDNPALCGKATFTQKGSCVLVEVRVSGLPKENLSGFFALHIHEGVDCTGAGFVNSGGHYNPQMQQHPNHAGDLPPLLSCGGSAYLCVCTDRFCVRDIIGKTIVIHSGADDFRTQSAGNAGEKIACGVICSAAQ